MSDLLAIYDGQLRREAELTQALEIREDGPLLVARFVGGGFVTYRDLGGLSGAELDALIERTVAHFRDDTSVPMFEWKSRGHDEPAVLGERLIAAGLVPDEVETVMIGDATGLAEAPVPDGVVVRRVDNAPDRVAVLTAAVEMQRRVFGAGPSVEDVLARLASSGDEAQFWVAQEASGQDVSGQDPVVISAGRLEFVPGTEVAGLWGGATDPAYRGRGIYRALTAARARATLDRGYRYLHSDCTAMSRPILERSGLRAVTTTTPYVWSRAAS